MFNVTIALIAFSFTLKVVGLKFKEGLTIGAIPITSDQLLATLISSISTLPVPAVVVPDCLIQIPLDFVGAAPVPKLVVNSAVGSVAETVGLIHKLAVLVA